MKLRICAFLSFALSVSVVSFACWGSSIEQKPLHADPISCGGFSWDSTDVTSHVFHLANQHLPYVNWKLSGNGTAWLKVHVIEEGKSGVLAKLDTVIRPNERTGEFEAAVMVTLVGPCPNPDTIEKVSWDLGSSCGLRQTCRNEVIDIGIPDIRAGVLYPLPEDVSGFLQSETRDK